MKIQSSDVIGLLVSVDKDVSSFSKSFYESRHNSLLLVLDEIGSYNNGNMLVIDSTRRLYTAPYDGYVIKRVDGTEIKLYRGMCANSIIDQYAKVFEDEFNNSNPSKWIYKSSDTVMDKRFKMSSADIESLTANVFSNFNIRIGSSWIENGISVAYVYITSRSYVIMNAIRGLLGETAIVREYAINADAISIEGIMTVSGVVTELKRVFDTTTHGFKTTIIVTLDNGNTVSGGLPKGSGKLNKGDAITFSAEFTKHSENHSQYTNATRIMTFG